MYMYICTILTIDCDNVCKSTRPLLHCLPGVFDVAGFRQSSSARCVDVAHLIWGHDQINMTT